MGSNPQARKCEQLTGENTCCPEPAGDANVQAAVCDSDVGIPVCGGVSCSPEPAAADTDDQLQDMFVEVCCCDRPVAAEDYVVVGGISPNPEPADAQVQALCDEVCSTMLSHSVEKPCSVNWCLYRAALFSNFFADFLRWSGEDRCWNQCKSILSAIWCCRVQDPALCRDSLLCEGGRCVNWVVLFWCVLVENC